MNKFKFQVVCMNKTGFILHYDNYHWDSLDDMLRYVEGKLNSDKISKIKITRWNNKGERE